MLLLLAGMLGPAGTSAAQELPGWVQRITAQLHSGESQAYLLKDLKSGDRLFISMQATSGDLDPAIGIMDTTTPLGEVMTRYRGDIQRLLTEHENAAAALEEVRNRYFLAWDDDSGPGYAADLSYTVAEPGDYVLIAGSSLSALGRTTAGTLRLDDQADGVHFNLDLPDTQAGRDLLTSLKRGDVSQCSFSALILEEDWDYNRILQTPVRTILSAELLEISVVPMPAFPATTAQVVE